MLERETLYCFSCGQFISREKAHKAFRTGFYRVVYPLAYCMECANREAEKAEEQKEHLSFNPDFLKIPESI